MTFAQLQRASQDLQELLQPRFFAGCLGEVLASMVAAHSRFRQLPGAMRVLAVELCHYVDVLISCAASMSPPPASPAAGATTQVAVSQPASPGAGQGGSGDAAAAQQEHTKAQGADGPEQESEQSEPAMPATPKQDSAQSTLQPGEAGFPQQHAAQSPADSGGDACSGQKSLLSEERGEEATLSARGKSEPPAPPAVRDLYEPLVAFVLELLSDADAGAKPAEIAAPLQLHLRALQIAQWQSSGERPTRASNAAEPELSGQLDLPAQAVQRFLRLGTPLTNLRWALSAATTMPAVHSPSV